MRRFCRTANVSAAFETRQKGDGRLKQDFRQHGHRWNHNENTHLPITTSVISSMASFSFKVTSTSKALCVLKCSHVATADKTSLMIRPYGSKGTTGWLQDTVFNVVHSIVGVKRLSCCNRFTWPFLCLFRLIGCNVYCLFFYLCISKKYFFSVKTYVKRHHQKGKRKYLADVFLLLFTLRPVVR